MTFLLTLHTTDLPSIVWFGNCLFGCLFELQTNKQIKNNIQCSEKQCFAFSNIDPIVTSSSYIREIYVDMFFADSVYSSSIMHLILFFVIAS